MWSNCFTCCDVIEHKSRKCYSINIKIKALNEHHNLKSVNSILTLKLFNEKLMLLLKKPN